MDQESTRTIEFPNMATDGEEPWLSSTAHVSVMILDDNANQPAFPPGPTKSLTSHESTPVKSGLSVLADVEEVSVSETTSPNVEILVITVTTTDADIGGKNSAGQHSITGGNQEGHSTIHPTSVAFSITSTDGSITVSNPMDQETTPTIEFPNMATDGEEPSLSSTARVSVMILDDNANQPAFPPGPTKSLTSHESTPVKSGLSVRWQLMVVNPH
jgi:translation elongation factor P/translation initiation factor 5A